MHRSQRGWWMSSSVAVCFIHWGKDSCWAGTFQFGLISWPACSKAPLFSPPRHWGYRWPTTPAWFLCKFWIFFLSPYACIFPTSPLPSPVIFLSLWSYSLYLSSSGITGMDHCTLFMSVFSDSGRIEWLSLTHPSPQSLTCIIWPFIDKSCELLS